MSDSRRKVAVAEECPRKGKQNVWKALDQTRMSAAKSAKGRM